MINQTMQIHGEDATIKKTILKENDEMNQNQKDILIGLVENEIEGVNNQKDSYSQKDYENLLNDLNEIKTLLSK